MFVYYRYTHDIILYTHTTTGCAAAVETIRRWSATAAAAAADMPSITYYYTLYIILCARCTRVYTTPRRFVKKLALSGRNHLRRC